MDDPFALRRVHARRASIALFLVVLALVIAAWTRIAVLVFAIKFDLFSPTLKGYLGVLGAGAAEPVALLYFLAMGLLLTAAVFSISAVTVPLMVDRDASPFTAIQTRLRAVAKNPAPMALWAGIIIVSTAFPVLLGFFPHAASVPGPRVCDVAQLPRSARAARRLWSHCGSHLEWLRAAVWCSESALTRRRPAGGRHVSSTGESSPEPIIGPKIRSVVIDQRPPLVCARRETDVSRTASGGQA